MIDTLMGLSRNSKRLLEVLLDLFLLPFCLWGAFVLRFGLWWPPIVEEYWWLFLAIPPTALPFFIKFGLYRAVLRYISGQAVYTIGNAVVLHVITLALVAVFFGPMRMPLTVFVIYGLACLVVIGGSRFLARALLQWYIGAKRSPIPVVIYGAGSAGAELAKAILGWSSYQPIAFIDDKRRLHGQHILGLTVYSSSKTELLLSKYGIQEILLAIPSASLQRRREVLHFLEQFHVHVKTIPALRDLISGNLTVEDIREIDIEDLLGREPIPPDENLLSACITGKSVMVTGAGGSIGSELCRQITKEKPSQLILYELSEFSLYQIEKELVAYVEANGRALRKIKIIPILGSITDGNRLKLIMKAFAVQTVYHAAAYKHVPLVEYNPIVGITNNIFGTWKLATAAFETKVEAFILISTDKAVRPTNVMGATKRSCELIIQALAHQHNTPRFSIVRFGNVLGSSGSVVPLFRKQIHSGGPVTVTDPNINRYFMTIPEAAQLVIQAGSMGKGGDVFVLDMGNPIRIVDLAKRMIHLSGLQEKDADNPNGDIAIEFTGLRPGEKLFEELVLGTDVSGTDHPRIMRAQDEGIISKPVLFGVLECLQSACERGDTINVREQLKKIVTEYEPQCDVKDLVWLAEFERMQGCLAEVGNEEDAGAQIAEASYSTI